jgi:hypothetical protein
MERLTSVILFRYSARSWATRPSAVTISLAPAFVSFSLSKTSSGSVPLCVCVRAWVRAWSVQIKPILCLLVIIYMLIVIHTCYFYTSAGINLNELLDYISCDTLSYACMCVWSVWVCWERMSLFAADYVI